MPLFDLQTLLQKIELFKGSLNRKKSSNRVLEKTGKEPFTQSRLNDPGQKQKNKPIMNGPYSWETQLFSNFNQKYHLSLPLNHLNVNLSVHFALK